MSGDWIKNSWSHRHERGFNANASSFVEGHKVKPFHGAHLYFLAFDDQEKDVMTSELTRNGGKICEDYNDETCTHIVVDDAKVGSLPSDIRKDLPIVKVEWFWASIQMDACAEEKLHLYSEYAHNYLSPGSMLSPGTPGNIKFINSEISL